MHSLGSNLICRATFSAAWTVKQGIFSLLWYVCIQWGRSPFCSCKASTFSRILLHIFPVSSWSDLFLSRKTSNNHSGIFRRLLLDAINSQEQSRKSTINNKPGYAPAVISCEVQQKTVPRVKINLTFHTSRKTRAKSGMKSKERRLRSTTSLRALGLWSVGERKAKL